MYQQWPPGVVIGGPDATIAGLGKPAWSVVAR
jgi:hypothetical protein